MDQLALAFTSPGIGHNQAPDAIDPIDGLNARLTATHADLLESFRDLELACGRVPDPIATDEDAAAATDFIAKCQLHLKQAEAAHRREKALILHGGRAVDAFFKGRCGARRLTEKERAQAVRQMALESDRIRGNDGATAFVRRSWTFEIVDLDQVPREYMSLDVPVVRAAITQDGTCYIPGLSIFQIEGLRVRATPSLRRHEAPLQREQAVEPSKSADAAKHRSSDQRQGPRMPKRRGEISSASDPRLVVSIKPIWGDQKVLRYYRQALASLQPHDAAEITKFRAANAVIEARLRRKLPHRMAEIDFLYGGSRVSPEAGDETPK